MAMVEVRGSAELAARLRDLRTVMKGDRATMKAVGLVALAQIGENFRQSGRPAWKPLALSTAAARRGKGGGKPLQDTGALMKSFDIAAVSDGSVTLVSHSPVAIFHEFGTRGPYPIYPKLPGGVLALPFLPGRDGPPGGAPGKKSLAGLGRATQVQTKIRNRRGRPDVKQQLIFRPLFNQKLSNRLRPRVFKAVVPYTKLAFYRHVNHPGLAARPMLPTLDQLLEGLTSLYNGLLAKQGSA